MQFLTALLGDSGATVVSAILALAVVLVLVVIGLWLLKATMKTTGNMGRPRNRRLSIVDQLQIDPKRQVMIIRRDDVEHVILTGGTQDLLIETSIASEQRTRRAPAAEPEGGQSKPEMPPPTQRSEEVSRLKDLVKTGGSQATPRRWPKLRNTGLLRPVSTMEPAVIPMPAASKDKPGRDSDMTTSENKSGQGNLGASRYFGTDRNTDG
ncbi:hypothetical protein [Devosia sp.]|uniref:hypothetical protein n=1 Tax=Devosia sp. TaxID=1871048 RepID=UPI003A95641C